METTQSDYDTALNVLNDRNGVNAHTDGGGMDNDLTVQLYGIVDLPNEVVEQVKSCGFELRSVGSNDTSELEWDALITFSETDEPRMSK